MTNEQFAVIKEQLLEEKKSRLKEYREYAKKIFFDKKGKEVYYKADSSLEKKAYKVIGNLHDSLQWRNEMIDLGWITLDTDVRVYHLTEKFSKEENA